jgi:aspartyl-tRNA(Asn)/glutamyl-tRNA(Gln) amidotransferase subunit C
MNITPEIVDKMAHLARLHLEPSEKDALIQDLEQILNWMAKLRELDTSGVEPLTHMSSEVNAFREDKSAPPTHSQEAFLNAPAHDGRHFLVPKVIDL